MKKHVILLVGLILVSTIFCLSASALEGKNGPYSYEVKKNGDLKITAFDWDLYGNEDVYIPKMIDGYSVTEIGDSAFTGKNSKEVAVIIPDTIVSIGEKAFFETSITTMHIPASVLSVGDGAFAGCKNIRQFSVDSSNSRYAQINGVLYNKVEKELVAYPHIEHAVNDDFSIPEGIVSIAPYAFYQCTAHIISEPSSLKSIGHHAFYAARIIGFGGIDRAINISSASQIGESAFEQCECNYSPRTGFESIIISKADVIPNRCFMGVDLGRHKGKIDTHIGINLPQSLKSIGDYAFASCDGIDNLTIPSSTESIGKYAFSEDYFYNLIFENDSLLKIIDDNAFMNSYFGKDMRSLELPEGIETVGKEAFYCDSGELIQLNFPTSVKSIGENVCDRRRVNISAEEGSYAYFWAIENGYTVSRPDDDTWLTESTEEGDADTSWLKN